MAESFADLTLADPLLAAIEELGLVAPNEMQSQLIPAVLAGRDVLAVSPAGSGGTTGYLLGLMQHLLAQAPPEGRGPRALVLAPTRDQAMQVGRMIKQLGHDTRLRFGTVVGGRPYPTQHQLLRRPLDILVATPGRLMDHIRRGRVPFERLKLLLLDKADQMLDMGLGSEIYSLVDAGGSNLEQTIILSDAPNDAVGLLAARLTRDPQRVGLAAELAVPAVRAPALPTTESASAEDIDDLDEDERQPAGLGDTDVQPRAHAPRAKSSRGSRRSGSGNNGNGAQGNKSSAVGKPPRGPRPPRQSNNGNGNGQKPAAQAPAKTAGKPAKGGLRGPGRRVVAGGGAQQPGQGGRGRRLSGVRFPSDYASGPGGPAKAAPAEPRGPQPNEPVQYSADYGFSVAPGARKPVNVVYRTKNRRRRDEDDESDNKSENGSD